MKIKLHLVSLHSVCTIKEIDFIIDDYSRNSAKSLQWRYLEPDQDLAMWKNFSFILKTIKGSWLQVLFRIIVEINAYNVIKNSLKLYNVHVISRTMTYLIMYYFIHKIECIIIIVTQNYDQFTYIKPTLSYYTCDRPVCWQTCVLAVFVFFRFYASHVQTIMDNRNTEFIKCIIFIVINKGENNFRLQ